MLLLKRVFLFLVFLSLVLVGIAYLLPREVAAERSIVIDRPPATVYTVLASMQRFNEWSPWAARDPSAEYSFSGPATGAGSRMQWQGNDQIGEGSQTIVDTDPFERIEVSLDFGPRGVADTHYLLQPVETGTRVTWGFRTDLGMNPVARYFGLLMDGYIGKDYETGLASLKTLVETLPEADFASLDASEVTVEAQTILYVRQTTATDPTSISAGYASAYQRIIAFMAERGLQQVAPPVGIESRADEQSYVIDAAIPIDAELADVPAPIQFGRTPAGLAARAVHVGDYAQLADSVTGLQAYIAARGKTASGPVWFVFIDDPTRVAPESVRTEIYQRME